MWHKRSEKYLFWSNIAQLLDPIIVHEDVGLCGSSRGALHHIWQQLPNFRGGPDTKSPLTFLCSSWCWDRICILCTVKPTRLTRQQAGHEAERDGRQGFSDATKSKCLLKQAFVASLHEASKPLKVRLQMRKLIMNNWSVPERNSWSVTQVLKLNALMIFWKTFDPHSIPMLFHAVYSFFVFCSFFGGVGC